MRTFEDYGRTGFEGRLSILGQANSSTASLPNHFDDRAAFGAFMDKPPTGPIVVYEEYDGSYKVGGAIFGAPSINPVSSVVNSFAAPADIAVGGSISGGEIDFYSVSLTAGETYMFSSVGSGATPLGDTFLYLVDTDGATLIDYDDDGGAGINSLLTFTATATGDYYIGVGAYPGSGLTGDYTLDVLQQPAVDVVPDTFAGATLLTLGQTTFGFIDSGAGGPYGGSYGEVDTYQFTVQGGMYYTFEVAGGADYASDYTNLAPGELDTVAVIYDSNGNIVAFNDDISFPGDISSRVGFFAETDGTYYLDVLSWAPWTGGYSITSSAVDLSTLDPLDALIWDNADNVQFDANNTAYVYFAPAGENFGELGDDGNPMVTQGWNPYEIQQVMAALDQYEKILGVDYQITTDVNQATFRLMTTESQQYGAYFYPQDPGYGTQQGIGVFNTLSGGWTFDQQQSLEQGGFAFAVILHEFGHAHGLSHPHDTGGGSSILAGVTSATGSLGVYDLNQGVYTVMSYNDAWETHPSGPSPYTAAGIDNGWSGTLSAFDIAALQQRYGVINQYATGDDVYVLNDVQARGTYYETIWDTAGNDTIRYDGASNARIDLMAATLDYSPTGGGMVSFVDGVWGGYTIANGVEIENATGGSGNDSLLGNAGDNVLLGNDGDDVLMGREGADILKGGAGFDTATYLDADSAVSVYMGLFRGWGRDGDASGDVLYSIEAVQGSAYDDTLTGSIRSIQFDGAGGDDVIWGGLKSDTLLGGDGNDDIYGGIGNDDIDGGAGDDDLSGGIGRDVILGGDGNDSISGGIGHDTINGGAGDDDLSGGLGKDVFVFTDLGGMDTISDFSRRKDIVDLTQLDAIDGGANDPFAWIGSADFSGTAGELRSYSSGGHNYLAGDTDGDMVADFLIQTNVLLHASDVYFI
ncbi:MAG: M10 family metallopeptidase C-terminal domain-containing protein [Parvularculaceae bacterium]